MTDYSVSRRSALRTLGIGSAGLLGVPTVAGQGPPAPTAPTIEFTAEYGGQYDDYAWDMIQTRDGGYALAGVTHSDGPGDGAAWLVKTDRSGAMEFSRAFGGTGYDVAWSVIQTREGGYVLAGGTESFGATLRDFWLVKTDRDGNEEFTERFSGSGFEEARSVVQTRDGGYALFGGANTPQGVTQCKLVKTDKDGTEEFTTTYASNLDAFGVELIQTRDGGFALLGTTDFFAGSPTNEILLVKTASDGTAEFSTTYGTTGGFQSAGSLVQTHDGGFAIGGTAFSITLGKGDVLLIRTDADGVQTATATFDFGDHDLGFDIVQTRDRGFAIGGYSVSSTSKPLLVKTDRDGTEQYLETYALGDPADVNALVQTLDGGFALAGGSNVYDTPKSFHLLKTTRA